MQVIHFIIMESCGIIDWSTAQVSDIASRFSGHVTVFGEESLKNLISAYEKQRWSIAMDKLFEQAIERAAALAPLPLWIFCFRNIR